jgi:hypothetical protein
MGNGYVPATTLFTSLTIATIFIGFFLALPGTAVGGGALGFFEYDLWDGIFDFLKVFFSMAFTHGRSHQLLESYNGKWVRGF